MERSNIKYTMQIEKMENQNLVKEQTDIKYYINSLVIKR